MRRRNAAASSTPTAPMPVGIGEAGVVQPEVARQTADRFMLAGRDPLFPLTVPISSLSSSATPVARLAAGWQTMPRNTSWPSGPG